MYCYSIKYPVEATTVVGYTDTVTSCCLPENAADIRFAKICIANKLFHIVIVYKWLVNMSKTNCWMV